MNLSLTYYPTNESGPNWQTTSVINLILNQYQNNEFNSDLVTNDEFDPHPVSDTQLVLE